MGINGGYGGLTLGYIIGGGWGHRSALYNTIFLKFYIRVVCIEIVSIKLK